MVTRKLVVCSLLVSLLPAVAAAQTITGVSLGGSPTVPSADDFATRAFQDPWDMSQKTDLGPWLYGVDQPAPGLTFAFNSGLFQATSANADPNLWFLDTGNPLAARIGKIGTNYPIDATKYTHLAMRFRIRDSYPEFNSAAARAQFFWSRTNAYQDLTQSGFVQTKPDWGIYLIDMRTIGASAVTGAVATWSGTIQALRFDPTALVSQPLELDWVRLVQPVAAGERTISWSGGNGDVYFDADTNATNGVLGLAITSYTNGALPRVGVPSGQRFNFGALAPGTYYVRVCPVNVTVTSPSCAYSTTAYTVGTLPTLVFTSPSPEGSSDDFATTNLGNPWDMNALSDLDLITNINNPAISVISGETEAGTSLGTFNAFTGTSIPSPGAGFGDPYVDPLFVTKRGANFKIDTTRYRLLTVEYGLQNRLRDIVNGSIARVVWRQAGEAGESVSDDIIINSRTGANVVNKFTVDMADRSVLAVEQGAHVGDPQNAWPTTGTSRLDIFRFDPHEFDVAADFFIKRIKLAAFERANTSYTLAWSYSKSSGTVALFYDTDRDPSGQAAIQTVNAASGTYTWNTTSVPNGTYYIHAVFRDTDGTNENDTYSKWPIIIDHSFVQLKSINVNRTQLNFGVTNSSLPSQVTTLPQTIRVTTSGSGPDPCWTATTDLSQFMSISPATQTCGSGTFTVSMNPPGTGTPYPVGDIFGTITVSSSNAANSPRAVNYLIRTSAFGTSTVPVGVLDTPTAGSVVDGSIGVTGWAVDDIDITRVTVCRDPMAGEPAPLTGNCGGEARIFIGDANLVEDARPDIQASFPQTPRNYRAGWGYLLLTNFLANLGNGAVTLRAYATDRDNHTVQLGAVGITANNQAATNPFGAIDTPGQGQTVCGTIYNFGWVLTPQPGLVPTDASTIIVYIDNLPIGAANQGLQNGAMPPRSDVQAAFSSGGYANINSHLALRIIDTTTLANGVHTIAWVVTDNLGRAAGVGSRFFTVANPCTP